MEKKRHLVSAIALISFGIFAGGSIITGELYELWFWGIGIVIFFVIGFTISSNRQQERKEKLDKANTPTSDFTGTIKVEDYNAKYSFAIDQEKRKIMIVTADNSSALARILQILFLSNSWKIAISRFQSLQCVLSVEVLSEELLLVEQVL